MAITTLVFSKPFSSFPHSHRSNGNEQTHQLIRRASTLKTLLKSSFKKYSLHSSAFATYSNSLLLLTRKFQLAARTSTGGADSNSSSDDEELSVGEDSASFDFTPQKISSWIYFSLVLGVVLFVLDFAWIDNSTDLGKAFVHAVSGLSDSHEVVMLTLILIFAIVTVAWLVSEMWVYFINHRYDGLQLWQLRSVPGVHQFVAAVEKPKMHLWETGIMRITRHPQMVGQVVWCLAHTLWIGNSVAVAASLGLVGHHLFGVWNGDRRLALRCGEDFEVVKSRTSVIPFAAILDGRQKLPKQYSKEFIRICQSQH